MSDDEKTGTIEDAVEAFLGIGFDLDSKVFRTQRDAREEAMRLTGFAQAQAALRNFLEQIDHPLKDAEYHPQALRPFKIGERNGWTPPELPVKARRR